MNIQLSLFDFSREPQARKTKTISQEVSEVIKKLEPVNEKTVDQSENQKKEREKFLRDGRTKKIIAYEGNEKKRLESVCVICGISFVAVRTSRKYCSAYCRHQAHYIPKIRPTCKCVQCGTEFVSHKNNNIFCSDLCYSRSYTDKNRQAYNARMRELHKRVRKETPWKKLLLSAKERARKKKLPFDLTEEWARSRWTGKCELTGMNFCSTHHHRGADSPSIDRIVPELGYIQSNSRFVLWAVNSLKAEGSDSDMYRVLNSILDTASPSPSVRICDSTG